MPSTASWRHFIEKSETAKRYTFELLLDSEVTMGEVRNQLLSMGCSNSDISCVHLVPGASQNLRFVKSSSCHRLATRGLIIGLLSGFIYAEINPFDWPQETTELSPLIINYALLGSLGALAGWCLFFILGLPIKSYKMAYLNDDQPSSPQYLISARGAWKDRSKIESYLNQVQDGITVIDRKKRNELGL